MNQNRPGRPGPPALLDLPLGFTPNLTGYPDWRQTGRARGRGGQNRGGRGAGGGDRRGRGRGGNFEQGHGNYQESDRGDQGGRGRGGRGRGGNWAGPRGGRGNRGYSQDRHGPGHFYGNGNPRSQSAAGNQQRKLASQLSHWANEPSDVIVWTLNSNNQSDLKELIASDLSPDEMRLFLKVLSTATSSDSCRQGVLDIFSEVFSEEFVAKLLRFQLTVSATDVDNLKDFFQDQHHLLSSYFKAMPFDALDKITELLQTVQLLLQKRVQDHPEEQMTEILKLYEQLLEHFNKYLQVKAKDTGKKGQGNLRDKLSVLDSLNPVDDFRDLPTEPTFEDIISNREPFVRRNIVMGPYADVDTYLDVQFRLLREDFIRPLREGVNDYIHHTLGRNQNVRIYKDVRFIRSDITRGKLIFSVKLNLPKKFKLETSKRLMFGNLVCATKDNFATFFLALIADKQDNLLRQGIVGISPLSKVDINFSAKYTLVESTAFFVAYKHVLKALQRMDSDCFPLVEHIVYVQDRIDPPAYLQSRPNVVYDMSVVLNPSFMKACLPNRIFEESAKVTAPPRTGLSQVSVCAGLDEWPPAESFKLDQSQLLAFHAALTSRLAIIQGPPGTGKTFLGLKIVQTLLHNSSSWVPTKKVALPVLGGRFARVLDETSLQPPILVVCFTNHALDQFLEGMQKFTTKIVRIGARSKNEEIQKYQVNETLFRLKSKKLLPSYLVRANAAMYSEFSEVETSFKKLQIQLIRLSKTEGLFTFSFLKHNEIIPPEIADQFDESTYRDWILPNDEMVTHGPPTAPMRSIWEDGHRVQENLPDEKTEEDEQWFDALELSKEEEQNCMIDDDTLFDVETAQSDIQSSDADFAITATRVEHELQMVQGQMSDFMPSPEVSMHCNYLTNKLLLLNRLATFAKVDVRELKLANELDIYSLCFQDRGLLYSTWKQKLEDVYQIQLRKLEAQLQSSVEVQYENVRQSAGNFQTLANLNAQIKDLQSRLRGLSTLSGIVKWDVLIESGRVPPVISNQLSRDTFLSWILPNDLDVRRAPIVTPMWQIWQGKRDSKGKKNWAQNEATWKLRMEMTRNEAGFTNLGPTNPNFLDVRSRSAEFEVMIENYDDKLMELSSMIGDTLTERNYQTLSDKIIQERECLRRVLSFFRKDVTTLKLKQNVRVRDLAFKDRCLLYATWRQKLISKYQEKCRPFERMVQQLTSKMDEIKRSRYLYVARQAHVVGMTTTGAAEYQAMIQDLRPKIVVIEEAAEILEAHVVTALAASCEHLIMIGDHQQLRPSASVYELAIKYGLETSMFERMIKNGLQYQTLEYQWRMRPEISRLLVPTIYPKLKDHESVALRPAVQGIGSSVFFVTHHHKEREDSDDNKSHSNPHEAEYIMQLARHLVLQGYSTHQITVLTPYSGQFFLLKQELRKMPECTGMHVTIVDNYQGEENDIILLSLVRSNDRGIVGFLKIENRVCVALSRAKQGLYIIGNLDQLCQSTPLWVKIKESLAETNSVGEALILRCQNHPDEISHIELAKEFRQMSPEGGCRKSCEAPLPKCSHICPRKCHVDDPTHEHFMCMLPCEKKCSLSTHDCAAVCGVKCPSCCVKVTTKLPCGHSLKLECHRSTDKNIYCSTSVEKEIPLCKHVMSMDCSKDPSTMKCSTPCPVRLDCGHACRQTCHVQKDPEHRKYQCEAPCALSSKNCSQEHVCPLQCCEECRDCVVEVTKRGACGHSALVKCSFDMVNYVCKMPCKRLLGCDHRCPRKCWQECGGCQVKVEKTLPRCGHTVKVPCSADVDNFQCEETCGKQLRKCGHSCPRKCYEACGGCIVTVEKTAPNCDHTAKVPCSTDISLFVCRKPCTALLVCGHVCPQKCGDTCEGCREPVLKTYRNCDHKIEVPCSIDVNIIPCKQPCKRPLSCGHVCPRLCSQTCGDCLEMVKKNLPGCSHTAKVPCSSEPLRSMCSGPCQRTLLCGQPCRAPCTTQCLAPLDCVEKCVCGHNVRMPCHLVSTITDSSTVDAINDLCQMPCSAQLQCGHECHGSCSECLHGRVHQPCKQPCQLRLLCGHRCPAPCGEPCPPCSKICPRRCPHKRCSLLCSDPCSKCPRPCELSCPHSRGCGEDCGDCKCVPCALACHKTLPCGHACVGYCGDLCPSLCRVCNMDQLKKSCLREMSPEELAVARFVLLPDCGHTVEHDGLRASLCKRDDVVRPKRCPLGQEPVYNCPRIDGILRETCLAIQCATTEYKKDLKGIDFLSKCLIDPSTGDVAESFLLWACVHQSSLVAAVRSHLLKSSLKRPQRRLFVVKKPDKHYTAQELHKFHFQTLFIVNASSLQREVHTDKTMSKQLLKLATTVMDKTVLLSNQFRKEVSCELRRIAFLAPVSSVRSSDVPKLQSRLTAIHRHMDPTKAFTAEMEWHVERRWLKCKDELPDLKITETKRMDSSVLTVKGMSEEAWSVCPEGHLQYNGAEKNLKKGTCCIKCISSEIQNLHL